MTNIDRYKIEAEQDWAGGMKVGMSTHKIKGEDYYQCRDVKAERDKLLEEVLRLRVAMAKAAQRADDWPDSNDDPADVLSDCASILFDALDYRHTSA